MKEFFQKAYFEKKSAEDKKGMRNYPVYNELIHFQVGLQTLVILEVEVVVEVIFPQLGANQLLLLRWDLVSQYAHH